MGVKTVEARGFGLAENFKFSYDPNTGVINNCQEGGLASQNGLTGWRVRSFKLPGVMLQIRTESGLLQEGNDIVMQTFASRSVGKDVRFEVGNNEHSRVLRELRPLTITFDQPADQPFSSEQMHLEAMIQAQEESELQAAIDASKQEQNAPSRQLAV